MLRLRKSLSPRLVTLEAFKLEMGIADTNTDNDDLLTSLINRAGIVIASEIGRGLVRSKYRESVPVRSGSTVLLLTGTPIAGLPDVYRMTDLSVDFESNTLEKLTDVFLVSAESGVIDTMSGLKSTERILPGPMYDKVGGAELEMYRVDYWGGWLPDGYEISATTISAVASDSSIRDSANGFPDWLQSGDVIEVGGFTAEANNGRFRCQSVTPGKIVVDSTVTDEAEGSEISIDAKNLPGDLEDAAMILSKSLFLARRRDRSIRSEGTGPFSISYGGGSASVQGSMPMEVQSIVDSYRRLA